MANKRNMSVAVLATFCLTVTIFSIIPVMSAPVYDPLKDVNDDGVIDAKDWQLVKVRIPSVGIPINKTELLLEVQTARTHNESSSTTLSEISSYAGMNWNDMAEMSVTIDLASSSMLVITFSAQARNMGTGLYELSARATVDAAPANPSNGVMLTQSTYWGTYSCTFYASNVSAGTHTVKIQWRTNDENSGAQVIGRTLIVTTLLP